MHFLRLALCGALCLLLASCSSQAPRADVAPVELTGKAPLRLSRDVVPVATDLILTMVPSRDSFAGHADIDINIRRSLRGFYLHGRNLTVSNAGLYLASGERVNGQWMQLDDTGLARIELDREVAPQRARLEITWTAALENTLQGAYRVRDGGQNYVFTQFESVYARQVFPGFDQPDFKQAFSLSLEVPLNHTAVANTPIEEIVVLENGLKRVRFAPTPPLPSYLVAFAVGPFDIVEGYIPPSKLRPGAVPFRGIAVKGKGADLAYAMQTTPQLLAVLEDYFAIAYPYRKLDIIAVPDFGAGAMENVGAITFRESLLLLKDDAPVLQRRRHAAVMAHELAHQWFGNLVTMPWWDDIWLNEAFATWISYKAVATWRPDLRAELWRMKRLYSATDEDTLGSARQIREPVIHHNDIFNAFDGITYSKGGAVLTMFEHYLGENVFRDGVRLHMQRFAESNADINDFLASLTEVAGSDIGPAFRSFLLQPGIPRIELATSQSGDHCRVEITQSRYAPLGTRHEAGVGWTVPVCLRYPDDGGIRTQCSLTDAGGSTVKLSGKHCPAWLMPNADFSGYFQWLLPASGYSALLEHSAALTTLEELSVADSMARGLASGDISFGEAMPLFAGLARSDRPDVALAPVEIVRFAAEHLAIDKPGTAALLDYAGALYASVDAAKVLDVDAMTRVPDDASRLFLLDVARFRARQTRDAMLRAEATARAQAWLGLDGLAPDHSALAPDALPLAFEIAVQDGGAAVAETLWATLESNRNEQFRTAALKALARASKPETAALVRDSVFDPRLKAAEIRTLLTEHVKQPSNRLPAWQWLQANFARLVQAMPPAHAGKLPEITRDLCDNRLADEVESVLGPGMRTLNGGPRNLAKSVEQIRQCAARATAQRAQFDAWATARQ